MIDTLKTHIKNKESDKVIALISGDPSVLDQKDENGASGLLLIVYSGLEEAINAAKEVKPSFTFHEAIVCGKMDQVRRFLDENGVLANAYSDDGFTPLSLAAFFNETEIAKLLLRHGANPNLHADNSFKVNALHSAVAKQNFELVRLLLESGADVNSTQTQNVTALHSAAHNGNLELVELLLEHGADIGAKMENGATALDMASTGGHDKVKSYLQERLTKVSESGPT